MIDKNTFLTTSKSGAARVTGSAKTSLLERERERERSAVCHRPPFCIDGFSQNVLDRSSTFSTNKFPVVHVAPGEVARSVHTVPPIIFEYKRNRRQRSVPSPCVWERAGVSAAPPDAPKTVVHLRRPHDDTAAKVMCLQSASIGTRSREASASTTLRFRGAGSVRKPQSVAVPCSVPVLCEETDRTPERQVKTVTRRAESSATNARAA